MDINDYFQCMCVHVCEYFRIHCMYSPRVDLNRLCEKLVTL